MEWTETDIGCMSELQQKYSHLKDIITSYKRLIVAYSGGVDSTLLLKVASDELGRNALGIIGISPSLAKRELKEAEEIARQFRLPYQKIETREMQDANYTSNPEDRCYFCKKELFTEIYEYASQNGFQYIADGLNLDDDGDFRPGRRAAKELRVVSPLHDAGLTKYDVREISRLLSLPTWNKPALACLASRFPTGVKITQDKLQQVEEAESFLYSMDFKVIRVRHHGNLARIEVGSGEISRLLDPQIRELISERFREIGYKFVTIDLNGYCRGSSNQTDHQKQSNRQNDSET